MHTKLKQLIMTLSTEITRKQDLTNDTIYANNDYPPVICLFFKLTKNVYPINYLTSLYSSKRYSHSEKLFNQQTCYMIDYVYYQQVNYEC